MGASQAGHFYTTEDKQKCTFIKFDIREFSSSITETVFDKALLFAKQHHDISNDNTRLIKHCCKSYYLATMKQRNKEKVAM